MSEKKRQGQEEEQGAVYSEVDKSKKNQNVCYMYKLHVHVRVC